MRFLCLAVVVCCARSALASGPPTAAATPRDVGFGIGLIAWEKDGTDASFDALNYFRAHPISQAGRPARVYLTDFPTDSDWHLSGVIDGKIQTVFDTSPREWLNYIAFTSPLP